ncbi:TPA: sulfotransferase [Candidatus Poribacteria bacterium]|nr:sulfotransferase [Candidatus Poribacteria bacterium]
MSLITIVGRGHSGTRAISHTLYASSVFMGTTLNRSGDKVPPGAMYDACRILAKYVQLNGNLSWDFEPLHTMEIDPEFEELIHTYLADVLTDVSTHQGWKIPETTLVYPWIVRMFRDIKYIHWIRDPRDCILGGHKTDDLRDFGINYPLTDDIRRQRAISWLYQYELMKSTPKPKNYIVVRFEDFVLKQEETLERLECFLGIPLARIVVRPDSVGRWKTADGNYNFDFLAESLEENHYH